MVFDIKGKIALITGGATGIGLAYSQELLRNGLKVQPNNKFSQYIMIKF